MLRIRLAALAVAPLALAVAASAHAGHGSSTHRASTHRASTHGAKSPFPVTVKAANGPTTIARRPTRIVVLSATATEDLFAIGAGPQVVAVDDQSNYPKQAPITKLSAYMPNAEAIATYRPDLVVVSSDGGIVAALEKLHIPVLVEPPAANLAQAYAQIEQLGAATGNRAGSAKTVRTTKAQLARVVASVPKQPLKVFDELSPDFYSATSQTFIGSVLTLFGLKNVADAADTTHSGYPQLSGEYLLAADPDIVVLSDSKCCGQTPKTVAARPGWSHVSAVRNHGVVSVSDDVASRWGPRIVQFAKAVAAAMRQY